MKLFGNRSGAPDPREGAPLRLTFRTMRALAVIGADPGLDNRQISERTGIMDEGQISRLLRRLSRQGLIEDTSAGLGEPVGNTWRLTAQGRLLEQRFESSPIASTAAGRA